MKKLLVAFALAGFGLCLRAAEAPIVIDTQHSRIEFDVKATMHSFTGSVKTYQADILADPGTGEVTKAQLQFKFADLVTGDEKRDRDMLAWEESDRFPTVVYTLTKLVPTAPGRYSAHGQLILHGVTRELAFPVTLASADKLVYSIDGETTIDTHDFNLPTIRKFGLMKVNPLVRISFHLQGAVSGK